MVFEVMAVNNAIRNNIKERQIEQIYAAIKGGNKEGMQILDYSLKALWKKELISLEEAISRASNAKNLEDTPKDQQQGQQQDQQQQ